MDQVLRSHSRLGLSLESNTMSNLKPDSAPRVVLRIQGFQCEQAAAKRYKLLYGHLPFGQLTVE